MPKQELSAGEKVALAGLVVLGRDYLSAAFDLCHSTRSTNKASLDVMRSKWINGKWAKEFMATVRQQYADNILAGIDEETELTDRQLVSIVQRAIVGEKDLKKQSDMSLKLMSFRKDAKTDDESQKNRPNVFIPWVSTCRVCPLMNAIKENAAKQGKALNVHSSVNYPFYLIEQLRHRQAEARKRIKANKKLASNAQLMKEANAIAECFGETLTFEDACDIYDYFRRIKLGSSSELPHWLDDNSL